MVKRQQSNSYTPHILVRCADYLISSGMNTQYLFKAEGDKKIIQQLVSSYNQATEFKAPLPEGSNPLDVAALIKCYLACLPEPIITYELYEEICGRRSNINLMRRILKKLPNVNYMTLEFVTALFLRVTQKSLLNKVFDETDDEPWGLHGTVLAEIAQATEKLMSSKSSSAAFDSSSFWSSNGYGGYGGSYD